MKTFLAALLAGGAKLGFRVLAFIAIVIVAAIVSWASPFAFFVLATIAFGCAWFGLVKFPEDDPNAIPNRIPYGPGGLK